MRGGFGAPDKSGSGGCKLVQSTSHSAEAPVRLAALYY
jgi:hypothetical protein